MSAAHHSCCCPCPEPTDPFERGQFLTVTGTLAGDQGLTLEPGFHVDYRRREPRGELTDEALKDAVVVEFLNERREILNQVAIPTAPLCSWGGAHMNQEIIAASVPRPEGYAFVRYYRGDRLLKEINKPSTEPVVRLTRLPLATASDTEVVEWRVEGTATDAEFRTVLLYSFDDGQSWQPLVPPSSKTNNAATIAFGTLPGGKARLKALATDGFVTASHESDVFEVPPKGVRLTILTPSEGAILMANAPVRLQGQAYDLEKRQLTTGKLSWRSSRDGELGAGVALSATLSPGTHEVTLYSPSSETSITITVNPDRNPPTHGDDGTPGDDDEPRPCGCP